MSRPFASSSQNVTTASEPLYQVKLLGALRSGDPAVIHPFLADLGRERSRRSQDSDPSNIDLGALALHLAIRCASSETVELLLSHRSISPNSIHPPESGKTALHLAASLGRGEIVTLLLDQPEVDDTLRDAQGKTCKEVARNRETARIVSDSRAILNARFQSVLRGYIQSPANAPAPQELLDLLSLPRIKNVDISQLDAPTGTTLLHEAARRKDLRLVELAVRTGADVFVRDRRGKGVAEGAGKDDRVKVFLRQFTNQDTTLLESPSNEVNAPEPPNLKGYLTKYVNVAKGYGTRWFVLKDGMLSYYRHQEDENVACRGSLSMKTSRLKTFASDKLRFEIHSALRNGDGAAQKWYMKANHQVEATRWTQAIQRTIDWYKKDGNGSDADSYVSGKLAPFDGASVRTSISSVSKGFFRSHSSHKRSPAPSMIDHGREGPSNRSGNLGENSEAEDAHSDMESKAPSGGDDEPPYEADFELQYNAAAAQMELTADLFSALSNYPPSSPKVDETHTALKDSYAQVQVLFREYTRMVQEREAWFKSRIVREKERVGVWEQSLQAVVQEGEVLETELKKTLRGIKDNRKSRRFSMIPDGVGIEGADTFGIPTIKARRRTIAASPTSEEPDISTPTVANIQYGADAAPGPISASPPTLADTDDEEDEEDEFFDAIESNTLPNLVVSATLASPINLNPTHELIHWIDLRQYQGYQHPRERLSITADDRPPVSLWAVLKGSIGKDLTKISFPVFFNEPTSMLQRMAEDMEFSECLDTAAAEPDQYKRIAFVAAFAMSNYSSTIGRIAKPFNPMLGETFEYVHLGKRYRYFSEQVSHHPPISACWADSPQWHYYGEVDAQNKFMGKSFEIRPTGVAHADLKLPPAWGSNYPQGEGEDSNKVIEHYSWKKVTTSVSGFILGSPTIDHYGEMKVTNHRTRDTCVLTFKPRGWRAKDSFEIKGQVMNAQGDVIYEIAGRWNSQLVARPAGNHGYALLPDVTVTTPDGSNALGQHTEYLLLWRNTEKPSAPFNLTPYAITLNDCPAALEMLLPPTDCRLRPDQRAFELGKYEGANGFKSDQEEFQRATRKKRELGEIPPHRPRWFEAVTEIDTGERYWTPLRVQVGEEEKVEYWLEREKVWKATSEGKEAEWKDVDRIFIDVEI